MGEADHPVEGVGRSLVHCHCLRVTFSCRLILLPGNTVLSVTDQRRGEKGLHTELFMVEKATECEGRTFSDHFDLRSGLVLDHFQV